MNIILTKKRLMLGILAVVILFVLQFALTHSVLTINSSGSEERTVYLRRGENLQKFTLKNSSKTLLLASGTYDIEVVNNDKLSVYQKKLGRFSKSNLNIELRPQKEAVALGISETGCAVDTPAGATYYSCDPNSKAEILTTTDGLRTQAVIESSSSSEEVLKPYGGGFLKVARLGQSLGVFRYDLEGKLVSSVPNITGFEGSLEDRFFSTAKGTVKQFALFDNQNKALLLFQNETDKNPRILDLAKNLYSGQDYQYRVLIGHQYAFILNTLPLEDHEDEQAEERKNLDQKLLLINIQNGAVIKEYDLPFGALIRQASASPSDSLVFIDEAGINNRFYFVTDKNKPALLKEMAADAGSICWPDAGSFYYSQASSGSIYRFTIKDSAAFLIYNNLQSEVVNLSCYFNHLHFGLTKGPDLNIQHFVLTDRNKTDQRHEEILPINSVPSQDIVSASLFKNTVNVVLVNSELYENRNNPDYRPPANASPTDAEKERVLKYLQQQGLDTKKLKFRFVYKQ